MGFNDTDFFVNDNNLIVFLYSWGWFHTAVAKVDLNDFSMELIAEDWDSKRDRAVDERYVHYAARKVEEFFVYDIQTGMSTPFVPQVDYDFKMRERSDNGLVLITMKNATKTDYFTILDLNGAPLFEPKQYYGKDHAFIVSDYLIYREEAGEDISYSFMRLADCAIVNTIKPEEGEENQFYPDQTLLDRDNGYIWFRRGFRYSIYSPDGEVILKDFNQYNIKGFFSDGFIFAQDGFYDINGEILKIGG
jgi:hypothetical protein